MTQQENNIKYEPIIEVGFHLLKAKDLDLNYWTDVCYNTKRNEPNSKNISNINLCNVDKFKPLIKLIQNLCYPIFNTPQLAIVGLWANISSFTNYNIPHTHLDFIDLYPYKSYSGVIYLKTPLNSGRICFKSPIATDGWIEIPPEETGIIIFPSTLEHYVQPNLSKEDRISLAFNFNRFDSIKT